MSASDHLNPFQFNDLSHLDAAGNHKYPWITQAHAGKELYHGSHAAFSPGDELIPSAHRGVPMSNPTILGGEDGSYENYAAGSPKEASKWGSHVYRVAVSDPRAAVRGDDEEYGVDGRLKVLGEV